MATVRFPKEMQAALIKLMDLEEGAISGLYAFLEQLPAKIYLPTIINRKTSELQSILGKEANQIAIAILQLHKLRYEAGFSIQELVNSFSDSITKSDLGREIDKNRIAILEARVGKLLHVKSVELSAKANSLALDCKNILGTVNILVDLRPLFSIDSVSEIAGGIIMYTLKIGYWSDRESHDIYFAMSKEDLQDIKKELDEALSNSKILEQFLSKTQIAQITEE